MTSSIPANAAQNPQPAAHAASTNSQAASFAGGDFQTFLKMLTTQIKHQDPLNPMESTDFAVQLATFSGVEQQVRTNQLLEDLAVSLGLSGVGKYAGWIGREARVAAPAWFDGTPVSVLVQPRSGADAAQLVVTD